ncbi:helix-turn-helix domain-containing protein [Spirosoma rhododendri]|uniref:Helix-turn-helix domain-containing protein n=1 Tax=Spirosoma rhododendri TaxID=2728024 RepID=A0A7L5DMA8_9BACT|nr:helix-turn-helix domain-containing protein [Spirosoma rhododendri]QJD78621.1 helix-turn-helix domain-containing protein [Spirosoma rhododendri]
MEQNSKIDEWITQAEAARIRGVSRQSINKLVKAGRLDTFTIGGSVFVNSKQIAHFQPSPKGRKKALDHE